MTQLYNAAGEVYFGIAGLDISASTDLPWVEVGQFDVLTLSGELSLGATPISGDLYAEFTNDPARLKCISRVVLPEFALHTGASTITMPTARTTIALASAATGTTFTVSFSKPGMGAMRWRWTKGTGGSSPNRLFGFFTGRPK